MAFASAGERVCAGAGAGVKAMLHMKISKAYARVFIVFSSVDRRAPVGARRAGYTAWVGKVPRKLPKSRHGNRRAPLSAAGTRHRIPTPKQRPLMPGDPTAHDGQ